MAIPRPVPPLPNIYILVTGANSGLGLATCCRLIDHFLNSRPESHQLTLIFTTRTVNKASATLATLKRHLSRHPLVRSKLPISNPRIFFRPETLELTSLLSVRALSQRLLRSAIPRLDAIILNAGMGGFLAIDWPRAIWSVITDLVQAVTWPTYKLSATGSITPPQFPPSTPSSPEKESVLAEVFCANVFGHYMLTHQLMPLLRACPHHTPARIIWLTSVEGQIHHFNRDDLQGLESPDAYEHSKRMTDLLALTAANQPATAKSIQSFIECDTTDKRLIDHSPASISIPTIHLAQPGICATSIVPLPWLLHLLMLAAMYLARLIGSPWHVVSAYHGGIAPVWLALGPRDEIARREEAGAVKWGSAVSRSGRATVQKTDVPGWGLCGDAGKVEWWHRGPGWLGGWGRKRGATDATREEVEGFVEDGALVWRRLEGLRREWEGRIERFEERVMKLSG